ncbi:hypothetical protein BV22DRAFT_1028079 [Leucogyrophana mollusca]|uniref:Uncharacterized protein n=1 Tax=Leucogyrophana mollusca TaxID=85980 RepID=A0ACB8BZI1_9AGAM|nr:hypothetical protein BV22DRAFT_1028079 [Leucogyrophana mollusca]
MKFFSSVVVLAAAAASAIASPGSVKIGYPTPGTILFPGENVKVQVIQPNHMDTNIQVGIALAIDQCENNVCDDPSQKLGSVLYAGQFEPTASIGGGRYQNFTVTLPDYIGAGPGIFTVTHLSLIGAGPYPELEYGSVSVIIGGRR